MLFDSCPPQQPRYGLAGTFPFACHRELSCFNACCRDKHLPLSPYDILRLKRALKIDSDKFLVEYAVYSLDSGSTPWRMANPRMKEAKLSLMSTVTHSSRTKMACDNWARVGSVCDITSFHIMPAAITGNMME